MRPAILLAVLAVAACDTAIGDEIARDQARKAVNPVLADKFPGIPLEPATNCVINNASSSEIFELAKAGVTGPDAQDAALVLEIAARGETLNCLASEGLPTLLAGVL